MNLTALNSDHLFDLSCHVYNKGRDGKYINCNDTVAKDAGFSKSSDLIGFTDADLSWYETASILKINDQEVIRQATQQIFFERGLITNKGATLGISFKMPFYSCCGKKILGIFGLTFFEIQHIFELFSKPNLQLLISNNLKNKLLTTTSSHQKINFSKRQKEVLHLLVRGKTVMQISQKLGLSMRTVESYLNDIKSKLGCHTKSELIDTVFDYFK